MNRQLRVRPGALMLVASRARAWLLLTLGMLLLVVVGCSQEEKGGPRQSSREQLATGFGDLLGWRSKDDAAARAVFDKALGPIFQELEVRGTEVKFVDEPNSAHSITASRPSHQSKVVVVAIDKKRIVATYADPSERTEMTWFALLHELQNALRAAEFRDLSMKAWKGELSEEAFVKGELSTEWDSLTAAYQAYTQRVWPELGALGLEPKGKVQQEYNGIEGLKKEDAVAAHARSTMGDYYRESYAKHRREGEAARKRTEVGGDGAEGGK